MGVFIDWTNYGPQLVSYSAIYIKERDGVIWACIVAAVDGNRQLSRISVSFES